MFLQLYLNKFSILLQCFLRFFGVLLQYFAAKVVFFLNICKYLSLFFLKQKYASLTLATKIYKNQIVIFCLCI